MMSQAKRAGANQVMASGSVEMQGRVRRKGPDHLSRGIWELAAVRAMAETAASASKEQAEH